MSSSIGRFPLLSCSGVWFFEGFLALANFSKVFCELVY